MPLLPGYQEIIDDILKTRDKPLYEMSLNEARETRDKMAEMYNSSGLTSELKNIKTQDVIFQGRHGNIPVRIYNKKAKENENQPVIIYFLGGGFVFGSLDSQDVLCRRLAKLTGLKVFSVLYRLAPENKFPVGQEDAYDAVKYLFEHADQFYVDSKKISLMGYSSGATYTAIISRQLRKTGFPINSQVLICPCMDFTGSFPARERLAEGYLLDKKDIDWFMSHYLPEGIDKKRPDLSPLYEDDLKDIPKTLIIAAEYCPFVDEDQAYAKKLREAGVPVTYSCYSGHIHALLLFIDTLIQVEPSQDPLYEIAEYLKKNL